MKVGKRTRIRNQLKTANKKHVVVKPKYLASCYGKIKHSTYEEAKRSADAKPDIVKPYKCQFCPSYHIGRKR